MSVSSPPASASIPHSPLDTPGTSSSRSRRSGRRCSRDSVSSTPSTAGGPQYFKFPPNSSSTDCRRSTSDLTEECCTQATFLSRPNSPRGLAYLASRRGSSNVSNEDLAPLTNFQNSVRGQQRRTSNFLELPGQLTFYIYYVYV